MNLLQKRSRFVWTKKCALVSLLLLNIAAFFVAEVQAQEAKYSLKPTPKTVAWGYYDAKATPALRVKSSDTVAVQTPSPSTPDQEEKPIIYVKHLEPPLHYPAVARAAQLQGTVIVKLTIAADGAVLTAESSSGYPLLRDETEKLVKKWTFGCANCSPRVPYEKTIKFIYRLEGEGISYDDTRIVMDLPNEVTITASPRECDHCPPKKSSHGGTK